MDTPHLDAFLEDLQDDRLSPRHLGAVLGEIRHLLEVALGKDSDASSDDAPAPAPAETEATPSQPARPTHSRKAARS